MEIFFNSSFFRENRAASLPTPAQIRALNGRNGDIVTFDEPPPVKIEAQDQGQTFLYMSLVDGDPLTERWPCMTTQERLTICAELRSAVSAWRNLRQDEDTCYIGSIHKQPLTDTCVTQRTYVIGPFQDVDAVKQFHDTMRIYIADPEPIVFTHSDRVACKILVKRNSPKLAAIIDWGQSRWYPA